MDDLKRERLRRGVLLHGLGRLNDAVNVYRDLLLGDPAWSEALNYLGSALRDKGCLREAREVLERAVDVDPQFAEAHRNLGKVLESIGELREAAAEFRRAIEIDQASADSYLGLARTLILSDRTGEAEECLRTLLRIMPDHAEAKRYLAVISTQERAGATSDPDCVLELADALHNAGFLGKSIETYSLALELAPESIRARAGLGGALAAIVRPSDAVDHLRLAIATSPNSLTLRNTLAGCYSQLGNLQEAADEFEASLLLDSKQPDAHFGLAVVRERQGRLAAALMHYRQAYNDARASPALRGQVVGRLLRHDQSQRDRESLSINPDLLRNILGSLRPDPDERSASERDAPADWSEAGVQIDERTRSPH